MADTINMSDIAKRAGVSRQAVKQWHDERTKTNFPAPVETNRSNVLFDREAVYDWLRSVKNIEPTEPEANGTDGIETKLWAMADKLRGHMDAAEYKHVVLGLIFLKYVSDTFEERHSYLLENEPMFAERRAAYEEENVFFVPPEARWPKLQAAAKTPGIGALINDAMVAIERENPTLKGVLPKDYAKPSLDATRLGGIIDLVSGIGLGDADSRAQDVIGRVYEYFLGRFASAEGKLGGEFYTPRPVVRLLVEMLEPYKGRVYDPCCGSGGMFVQSEDFVQHHGGRINDLSIYGQESNHTTWRLAKMNLAIRGIEANLGPHHANTFENDLHRDQKFEYILANPPFNVSDWGGERLQEDARWKYGTPPKGNANFAWVQHFIHHLHPQKGTAGFVLANGSMSSNQSGEGEIRKAIIEDDLVDCMIALPGQLFYTTPIPVCLWFLSKSKRENGHRDRRGETLFIDARNLGAMVNRTLRELSHEDISRIASAYHAWRSPDGAYEDVPGFCGVATLDDIREHGHVLTPGRYVGSQTEIEDDEPFPEKMARLTSGLFEQFEQSRELEGRIRANLVRLGYGN